MDDKLITIALGVIAGLLTWIVSERRLQLQYITDQRAKWRGIIRKKSKLVYDALISKDNAKLSELKVELAILLNPYDCEDIGILDNIEITNDVQKQATDFIKRITLLLKHDWDRAKRETKWYGFLIEEPVRTKFDDFSKYPERYRKCRKYFWNCP